MLQSQQSVQLLLLWVRNLSKCSSFFLFLLFKNLLLSAGINLGQIFDSIFFTFVRHFPFSKYAETTFLWCFQQKCLFSPPPKKLGTLFVNITALTDFLVSFLQCCLGFCCVWFFGSFLLKGVNTPPQTKKTLNTKQPKKKQDHKMQRENHLVLLQKRKQTIQTQNNTTSLFRLQTRDTRNKKARTKTLNDLLANITQQTPELQKTRNTTKIKQKQN